MLLFKPMATNEQVKYQELIDFRDLIAQAVLRESPSLLETI